MKVIQKYFKELTPLQIDQFSQLQDLYTYWNSRINVISRKDIDHLYLHHVLHSLAVAKIVAFPDGAKVLDVGTGGGFPGIPLAILFPQVKFSLIDGTLKKIKVVNHIKEALHLENVNAYHMRVESLRKRFEFIVSRAVTTLPSFYKLVEKNLNYSNLLTGNEGIYYLKGGDVSTELAEFKGRSKEMPIADFFTEAFFETKKVVYISLK
ncbi:MAG: 16S rRNA (guanine(527)-N(7))-methyltransferase RsmG [Bacteroidales bacterium]|nr:16S rRNA (guanine(527)-N(7))-methyltransferase RsmG [Bacteroidales bacterium]